MRYKQLIVVRQDLKMPKGKTAAQAAHASVEAVWKSSEDAVREWRSRGMPKIVVKVPDEKALLAVLQQAKDAGFVTGMITDAGKTCVAPGTRTCLGIGPAPEDELDTHFSELKLL